MSYSSLDDEKVIPLHDLLKRSSSRSRNEESRMSGGGGGGGSGPMDPELVRYRLDQNEGAVTRLEGRAAAIEATLIRIEGKLDNVTTKAEVAALPTKESSRNTALALAALIVAAVGLLYASSANQLSSFQAGLSAVQTVIAVKQLPPQ